MGYTHYYYIQDITKPLMTSEIAQDIENIIMASEIPLGDGSDEPDSQPILEHDLVQVNGIGDEGHETLCYPPDFEWNRKVPPAGVPGHPPSARPHASPTTLWYARPSWPSSTTRGATWRSLRTGKFNDEWQPAYRLYRRATGRELPTEFREYERPEELLQGKDEGSQEKVKNEL